MRRGASSSRGWIAIGWLALASSSAGAQLESQDGRPGPTPVQRASRPESERERIERWRDALLIDRPREVLAEAEAIAADHAWNGEALALVARAALAARGSEQASQWLTRPVTPETSAWVELERARIALEGDELPKALSLLLRDANDRAPRLAPYADAWLYAGRAWTRLGEGERGAAFLARFVELATHDAEAPSALHALAQAALARQDARAAEGFLRRADESSKWQAYRRVRVLQIRESPGEPLPRLGLAQLWLQARDAGRAKSVLSELLARHPDYAPGWFHLGEAERLRDDLEAAFAAYSTALECDPEHVLARHNRGAIHRLRGRTAEARSDFERVVDGPRAREKSALNTHLALARLLAAAGEREQAQRRYAGYRELGGTEALEP